MTKLSAEKYMLIVMYFLVILPIHCRSQQPPEQEPLQVVATILPLAEFVEQVGGDSITVSVMVPPGASPHTYEPTPSQMTKLSKAHMYVMVGTPIEFELVWLDKLLALNTRMTICNTSDSITLLHSGDYHQGHKHHDAIDPHTWLSVRNAQVMVQTIYRALASIAPDYEPYFRTNVARYSSHLDSLDSLITDALKDKQNRVFIAYHSAWNYFAHDYGLDQMTIETDGKEPSARHIKTIITFALEHNIRIVFASPQFDPRYAEEIAHAINGQVILVDPLAKDYIGTLAEVAHTLAPYME